MLPLPLVLPLHPCWQVGEVLRTLCEQRGIAVWEQVRAAAACGAVLRVRGWPARARRCCRRRLQQAASRCF